MDVPAKSDSTANKHIFISYCHRDETTVHKICTCLQNAGYHVWIDIQNMEGNILKSMAEAVENAWVVLICMSSGYSESQNCQTEAEYTYQKNKEYVFLRMQEKFTPNGWLGAIMRGKLYYDFSQPIKFDEMILKLQQELERIRIRVFPSLGNRKWDASNWELGTKLIEDPHCCVYHVHDLNNPQTKGIAVKQAIISDDIDSKTLEQIDNEMSVLKQINHNRIVTLYGYYRTASVFSMFISYLPMGSLTKYINSHKNGHLEEEKAAQFTYQILDGLQYLHSKKIIHRNIKGSNILLADENNIKISEFGVAKILDTLSHANTEGKGTVFCMAPERFQDVGYDCKVDVWSLGCTVFQMISGNIPFQKLSEFSIIKNDGADLILTVPATWSENVKNFITLACERNPDKRPSASELMKHAFVQDAWIYDFSNEILEKRLSESEASKLGTTLGSHWEAVMFELGIKTAEIEIEKENQRLSTINNLILKWRQRNGDKANCSNFLKALLRAEKQHSSTIEWDNIKEYLSQK